MYRKERSIKEKWGSHTFTQSELDTLFSGGKITVTGPTKKGGTYTAELHLEEYEYEGRTCFGP